MKAQENLPPFLKRMKNSIKRSFILLNFFIPVCLLSQNLPPEIDLLTDFDAMIYGSRGGTPENGDLSGWDLGSGDLDGDGIKDLIISSIYAEGPDPSRPDQSQIWIFFGKPSSNWAQYSQGITSADVVIYGNYNILNNDKNWAGWDIECGDLDGDGMDELAIGAPHADGYNGTINAAGAIYLFYGKTRSEWDAVYDLQGVVGVGADIEISGSDVNDAIGGRQMTGSISYYLSKSIAFADVNGDNYDDLLFGAILADGATNQINSCGDAYIIFGKPRASLDDLYTINPLEPGSHADVTFFGSQANDYFGFAIAVGDLNGDNIGDVCISALYGDGLNNAKNGAGEILVFFGRNNWPAVIDLAANPIYDILIEGRAVNSRMGYRLVTGNIDGDAYDDLIISTADNRSPLPLKSGEHFIVFGNSAANMGNYINLGGTGNFVWLKGVQSGDAWGNVGLEIWQIGCDVTTGDVNGDGKDDLLIAAKFGDGPEESRTNAGEAYLILGRQQTEFGSEHTLTSGDIVSTVIWGAEGSNTGGTGGYSYDAVGHSVLLSDLTGDGTDDIIISAPFADGINNSLNEAGETIICFSRTPQPGLWTGSVSTNWHTAGNWDDNTVPTVNIDVTIPTGLSNYPTLSSAGYCNNLYMQSSAAGETSLLDNGFLSVGGDVKVERYLTAGNYHSFSPSVTGAAAGIFNPGSGEPDVYLYSHNEINHQDPYEGYFEIVPVVTPLNVMDGYAVWVDGINWTFEQVGGLNTGVFGKNLYRTGPGDDNTFAGFNYVGNPYPSFIDWDASSGWIKTNLNTTTWIENNGNWATYTPPGPGVNGGSNIIAPGQGFFVRVGINHATGAISMDNPVRTHASNPYLKNTVSNYVKLMATGNDKADEMVIRFDENATVLFDSQYDGLKLPASDLSIPQIYSVSDLNLAYNAQPAVEWVQLGFEVKLNGEYAISLMEVAGIPSIWLEDTFTGEITNLMYFDYTFIASVNDDASRFILHFTPLSEGDNYPDDINIYSYEHDVYVSVPEFSKGTIKVYNLMGQEMAAIPINSPINRIALGETGYYVVVVTSENRVKTDKVFIR